MNGLSRWLSDVCGGAAIRRRTTLRRSWFRLTRLAAIWRISIRPIAAITVAIRIVSLWRIVRGRRIMWRRRLIWRRLLRRIIRRRIVVRRRSVMLRRRLLGWITSFGFLRWRRGRILFLVLVILLSEHQHGHHQKQIQDGPLGKDFFDLEIQIHRCLLNFLPRHPRRAKTSIVSKSHEWKIRNAAIGADLVTDISQFPSTSLRENRPASGRFRLNLLYL